MLRLRQLGLLAGGECWRPFQSSLTQHKCLLPFLPVQVGSWAQRVTTFTNAQAAAPTDSTAVHAGG